MTDKRLEEIRKRADAATEGPWVTRVVEGFTSDHGGKVAIDSKSDKRPWMGFVDVWFHCSGRREGERNARFIAHARQDIPDLLSHIEELERERDGLAIEVARLKEELRFDSRQHGHQPGEWSV